MRRGPARAAQRRGAGWSGLRHANWRGRSARRRPARASGGCAGDGRLPAIAGARRRGVPSAMRDCIAPLRPQPPAVAKRDRRPMPALDGRNPSGRDDRAGSRSTRLGAHATSAGTIAARDADPAAQQRAAESGSARRSFRGHLLREGMGGLVPAAAGAAHGEVAGQRAPRGEHGDRCCRDRAGQRRAGPRASHKRGRRSRSASAAATAAGRSRSRAASERAGKAATTRPVEPAASRPAAPQSTIAPDRRRQARRPRSPIADRAGASSARRGPRSSPAGPSRPARCRSSSAPSARRRRRASRGNIPASRPPARPARAAARTKAPRARPASAAGQARNPRSGCPDRRARRARPRARPAPSREIAQPTPADGKPAPSARAPPVPCHALRRTRRDNGRRSSASRDRPAARTGSWTRSKRSISASNNAQLGRMDDVLGVVQHHRLEAQPFGRFVREHPRPEPVQAIRLAGRPGAPGIM